MMALKPKDAVFQVRVERDLLERFRVICEVREMTVSFAIRRFMQHQVEQEEARQRTQSRGGDRTA
ncbi:hypothetical protein [Janthinobacterium sp.]|uniref:hypothetical protein n=1 Tax=Janthinobacterium sp. TaxID=1871054 RepID=UPI002588EA24|nr:hypothetical protein [Janthinobacterium sp.]MCX7289598.1 hypothetical protein [Janthinobacterium sp.]